MTHQGPMDPHLDAGLLAAFVDGRLETAEAKKVEAHLAECADCRREAIEVRRLLPVTAPGWRWPAIGALAAAAVLVLVVGGLGKRQHQDGSSIRGAGHPEPLTPRVIAPAESATVSRGALTFVWHGVSDAAAYRLALTDERGDVVWTTETADTAVAAAPSARLRADHA